MTSARQHTQGYVQQNVALEKVKEEKIEKKRKTSLIANFRSEILDRLRSPNTKVLLKLGTFLFQSFNVNQLLRVSLK